MNGQDDTDRPPHTLSPEEYQRLDEQEKDAVIEHSIRRLENMIGLLAGRWPLFRTAERIDRTNDPDPGDERPSGNG